MCDLCQTCVLLFFVSATVSCFVLLCVMRVCLSLAYLLLSLHSGWACSVRALQFTSVPQIVSLQASDAPPVCSTHSDNFLQPLKPYSLLIFARSICIAHNCYFCPYTPDSTQYTMFYAVFLPAFYWALPVYREPFWFEVLISDFLGWTRYEISQIVNKSDMLMRLMNHPFWKFVDLFPIFIAVSIIFFVFSFWQVCRDRAAGETVHELPGDTPEMQSQILPSSIRASAANTLPQPKASAERVQSIANNGTPGSLSLKEIDVGRYSPGLWTPYTGSSNSSDSSGSSRPHNVPDPKYTDPVSYYLQKGMRLVEDWAPAKKDGEHDDDEYEVATLYDPPTRTYASYSRRRKNVGK